MKKGKQEVNVNERTGEKEGKNTLESLLETCILDVTFRLQLRLSVN
jgi:hypothetical protein